MVDEERMVEDSAGVRDCLPESEGHRVRKGVILGSFRAEVATLLPSSTGTQDFTADVPLKGRIVLQLLSEEMSIDLPESSSEGNSDPEGGSEMAAVVHKRRRMTLKRPSAYPLPKGLLTIS